MSDMRERLIHKFHERRYREGYLEAFLNTRIAAQIKALREARRLSQAQLAERAGTTQPGISALENVHYSSWSLRTLRKLAKAFDVALVVKFESYGNVLDDITGFGPESLAVPGFKKDPAFSDSKDSGRAAYLRPGGSTGSLPTHDRASETETVLAAATLTEKHQITIPAEVRKRLRIAAGDLVVLALEGDHAVLRAEHGGWTETSRGLGAELWQREGGGEMVMERERASWE